MLHQAIMDVEVVSHGSVSCEARKCGPLDGVSRHSSCAHNSSGCKKSTHFKSNSFIPAEQTCRLQSLPDSRTVAPPADMTVNNEAATAQVLERIRHQGGELASMSADAYTRISSFVLHTPLMDSAWLTHSCGAASVSFKMESEQHTGSFKCRGALNKLLRLNAEELSRGIITSSTGNHALGVVWACKHIQQRHVLQKQQQQQQQGDMQRHTDVDGAIIPEVYVPCTVGQHKLDRLQLQGACIKQVGQDCVDAEVAARRAADARGAVYVSPYNELQVMAGQGTIGVEIVADMMHLYNNASPDVVIVPVGGGGLVAGIAAVVKAACPHAHVVGAQPAASAVLAASVKIGHVLQNITSQPTLSDATAGGVEADALTLAPCMEYVDEWVLVEEHEIADGMRGMLLHHSKLIEGAAGCAVAACCKLSKAGRLVGKHVVLIACGGNVSLQTLKHVLQDAS